MINFEYFKCKSNWAYIVSPTDQEEQPYVSLQFLNRKAWFNLPRWLIKSKKTDDPNFHEIRFGISLDQEVLTFCYGDQYYRPADSSSFSIKLPWREKILVRSHILNFDGTLHAGVLDCTEKIFNESRASAPCVVFAFKCNSLNYSGVGHIQEYEWQHGTGFFNFISWFKPNIIERCLKVRYGNAPLKNTHCTLLIPPEEKTSKEVIKALNRLVEETYGSSDLEILQINYKNPFFSKQ